MGPSYSDKLARAIPVERGRVITTSTTAVVLAATGASQVRPLLGPVAECMVRRLLSLLSQRQCA